MAGSGRLAGGWRKWEGSTVGTMDLNQTFSFFFSSFLLHLLLSSQRSFAPTVWLSGLQRLSVCGVWLDWKGAGRGWRLGIGSGRKHSTGRYVVGRAEEYRGKDIVKLAGIGRC